ncbi:MAG: helix-turn-helix transcriptional regulator [Pikeienuella sp.]
MLSATVNIGAIMRNMLENQEDKPEAIAARLHRVREILGLTKREFAEKAGMSEQVYGPFENARRDLTLQAAKKLRKTYSLPLEFLYFGKVEDLPTRISMEL